ncbi:MAG: sigma-54-dependent Fis family transcriptional regulator [Acidobacteria bacterium]|nr:sigma-54-dependent Fis family transcriptional regulator [Acidobacteriota bacterium]
MKKRLLVVDDEPGIRQSLTAILQDEGWLTQSAASGKECLRVLDAERFQVVLLDVWLGDGATLGDRLADGLEVLRSIREAHPDVVVVMISGHGNIETAVKATKLGAFDFLEKPLSIEKTLVVVKNALEHQALLEENRQLRGEREQRSLIIGESVPMKALRQQLLLMAPTNGRVLIYGESGTGKELVAHALHEHSLRASGPFVEVNCAALPEELIESDLFGHRKGSFPGAAQDKTGKFQKADGGTLFLDEVGDMSLKTQAKVMRALAEQRIDPVGSPTSVSVDVRVIAATNKNLDEEIARGNFREDLFYRLNVIPFVVPPLREREEDIPRLAEHFIAEFTERYGRKAKTISPEALAALASYRWPGNVRELKNLIERIVIMTPQAKIERKHLPALLFRAGPTGGAGHEGGARKSGGDLTTLRQGRAAYERDFILRKLEENRGNVSRTAQDLGLERSHLYRKMKTLSITPG